MATVISQKLVLYIIPIIVAAFLLFNYYGGDESAFESLKSGVDSAKEYVPNISIGDKGLSTSKPTIPAEHKAQLLRLNETINQMLKSSKQNCFANYGGFSELGEKGTSFVMTYSESGTKFKVFGGAGGDQLITDLSFEIEGMIPCVIAGSSTITENFENSFLTGKNIVGNHFMNVNVIALKTDDGGAFGLTENRIDSGSGPKDFEDAGFIYTPDNEHICFFPTVDGGSDADGLDDDFLGETPNAATAVPRQVSEGRLKTC